MDDTETLIVTCECHNVEHNIILEVDFCGGLDEYPIADLHVQMNHYLPWYKRIIPAFWYLLGNPGPRYSYEETCLSRDDAEKVRDLLDRFIDARDSYQRYFEENRPEEDE